MSTESLPFVEEAVDTGIGSGNGAADGLASETAEGTRVAGSSEEETGNAGDYSARLREGGEFAENEVKNWERKFGKANTERDQIKQQLRTVESLLPVVESLGGTDEVIKHLERLGRVVGDPKMGPLLQQFETTGDVRLGSEESDEYIDPLEKEMRNEIAALKGELQNIRGSTLRQDGALAQQKLKGHFKSVLDAFPFNEEEVSKITEGVESHIEQWSKTEQGVRALESLNEKTVRTLVIGMLDNDEWSNVIRRKDQNRHEEKKRMATDAPASTATNKAQTVVKTAEDAFREACKELGMDAEKRLI